MQSIIVDKLSVGDEIHMVGRTEVPSINHSSLVSSKENLNIK